MKYVLVSQVLHMTGFPRNFNEIDEESKVKYIRSAARNTKPDWGTGLYSVDEDGKMKLVSENFDTSG